MNYYPYYPTIPYATVSPVARGGLSSLFKGIKWSSILNGIQKTLGIVNQAIPIIKQAGPVINNAKTMFHVMNEFKKIDQIPNQEQVQNQEITKENNIEKEVTNQNNPVFFQ